MSLSAYLHEVAMRASQGSTLDSALLGQPDGSDPVEALALVERGRTEHPGYTTRDLLDWAMAVAADADGVSIDGDPTLKKIASWIVTTGIDSHPGPYPIELRAAIAQRYVDTQQFPNLQTIMEALIAKQWT